MSFDLVVFDFDGVIVDSETLANQVLADELTARGCPTTLDDAFNAYMGHHWADCLARIGARWGAVPADLRASVDAAIEARADTELRLIAGVDHFLARLGGLTLWLPSSSAPLWLRRRLAMSGLTHHFGDRLFSATVHVARGKPHPDVFLKAAELCGVAPEHCIVFEDAPLGVEAARRAGMRCVVLTTTLPRDAFTAFDNVIAIVRDFSELKAELLFA